jgi:tRNA pseudouridine38-40 synthase
MPFLKITLAYDGAAFCGWQWQPTVRTVQGEFQRAWRAVTGETVVVTAAGRTDAGVHAAGQVLGVETSVERVPGRLALGLNAALPDDVSVLSVEAAPEGFHATHEAKRKRYRYALFNDRRRPVFLRNYVWHVPTPLDVEAMHRCGQELVGEHDFSSFQSVGSERDSTVRTIYELAVRDGGAGEGRAIAGVAPGPLLFEEESRLLVTIDVEGDGFLYNMVRAIAGTLVVVGRGRRSPGWLAEVLAACDRNAAGQTAPPQGLTLLRVEY